MDYYYYFLAVRHTIMIVIFNEIFGFCCELIAILSATGETFSLHFLAGWSCFCGFIFVIILGSNKITVVVISYCQQRPSHSSYQIYNLQNPFLLMQILMNCVKTHKIIWEKYIYWWSYIIFYVLFLLCSSLSASLFYSKLYWETAQGQEGSVIATCRSRHINRTFLYIICKTRFSLSLIYVIIRIFLFLVLNSFFIINK